jgi:hypothetical protein
MMRLTRVGLCEHCDNLKETEREYGVNKKAARAEHHVALRRLFKAAAAAATQQWQTRRPL